MKKKKEEKVSSKAKGKMSALKSLHKMASDMMGSDLADLKKVTVMAKDKKGLMEGLEKAEELLEKKKKDSEEEDEDESEC